MSSEQFPPSSPILSSTTLLQEDDGIDDKFQSLPKKSQYQSTPTKKQHHDLYPTPNPSSDQPSSSMGQIQSPVKEGAINNSTSPLRPELVNSGVTPSPKALASDSSYKFISPMDNVKVIKLAVSSKEYKFGRASSGTDVQLDRSNKSISKLHFTVAVGEKYLEIKCLGRNGMNFTVPRPSVVKFLGEPSQYLIETLISDEDSQETSPMKSELNARGLSAVPRCNQKYDNLTNVLLLRGEVVKIPKIKGILLDIWDEFVLLDFDTESANGDEKEVIVSKDGYAIEEHHVALCYKPSDPMGEDVALFKKPESNKRGRPRSSLSPSPSPQVHSSPNTPVQQTSKKAKPAIDDAPVELYKDITDEEVAHRLAQIDDLTDIENVLINHLAFSRLSSTPLSTLHRISHKTSGLSKADLQLILIKKIECCGVIYRIGKDAAGKPLEEEYYYQLDLDTDSSRQKLVNDLKGAGGSLRSCRKVHKQYFWKKPKSAK